MYANLKKTLFSAIILGLVIFLFSNEVMAVPYKFVMRTHVGVCQGQLEYVDDREIDAAVSINIFTYDGGNQLFALSGFNTRYVRNGNERATGGVMISVNPTGAFGGSDYYTERVPFSRYLPSLRGNIPIADQPYWIVPRRSMGTLIILNMFFPNGRSFHKTLSCRYN